MLALPLGQNYSIPATPPATAIAAAAEGALKSCCAEGVLVELALLLALLLAVLAGRLAPTFLLLLPRIGGDRVVEGRRLVVPGSDLLLRVVLGLLGHLRVRVLEVEGGPQLLLDLLGRIRHQLPDEAAIPTAAATAAAAAPGGRRVLPLAAGCLPLAAGVLPLALARGAFGLPLGILAR